MAERDRFGPRPSFMAPVARRQSHPSNTKGTIESVYLRIIVHNNEHMGQLIAYARMNGKPRRGPRQPSN